MKTNIVQIMRTHLLPICAALLVPTIFAAEGVDGDNYEEMKVSLRNNPSPMPQKAKALDALTFEAVGDLGVIKGQGETITLYFNVDVDSLDISSASVTMNAYDVDYPRASECDEVYFNGEHLGRLRGGDNVWHENTFAVPVNAINRGKNTIRINVDVDRIGWITAIGWARLTLKGHAIKLTASDGSEPDGIEVKWTDMGSQYQYALYRGTSKDGPFKQIETVKTNSYFDTAVRYGQPYWYYVEASESEAKPNLRSNVDEGLRKADGALPKIEDIEVASLWLTGEGPYNLGITWNDFDNSRYAVRKIQFSVSDADLDYEWKDGDSEFQKSMKFNLSKKGRFLAAGQHGRHQINIRYSVWDKVKDKAVVGVVPEVAVEALVYFDKYGHVDGTLTRSMANWYKYWIRDGAIAKRKLDTETLF